jgi:GMP synthase-like glutamine amidotransferase
MQIGLLQCDHVSEQFRHVSPDYPEVFRALFATHAPQIELRVYDVCHGELPAQVDECAGYITTGSRYSVYDDVDWIHQLADFVRRVHQANQKYVGICFGHQMLAHALGGKVAKADSGWGIGIKPVSLNQRRAWMQPDIDTYQLLLSHQDQVLIAPPGAEILGGNGHCPISMLAVGDHMLGIQAHPEFSVDYARELMEARRERIGSEIVDQAQATLLSPTDSAMIVSWIEAFLQR